MRGNRYIVAVLIILHLRACPVPNPPSCLLYQAKKRTMLILQLLSFSSTKGYRSTQVTRWHHAIQCAHLARTYHEPKDVQIACLLHDIGYVFQTKPTEDHATLGASVLRTLGFHTNIVQLVARHEQAKQFLMSTSPTYYEQLRQEPRIIEHEKEKPMSAPAIEAFKEHPLFDKQMALCTYDLQAHDPHKEPLSIEVYEAMLCNHLYIQLAKTEKK